MLINRINPSALLRQCPQAVAMLKGSSEYAQIRGNVRFYQTEQGVLVAAEVNGLPEGADEENRPIFGFHIHEGSSCSGNAEDPFADAGAHFNPEGFKHPYHAGDMPPLFGNKGYALLIFFTNRFAVKDIVGRTVIVHSMPDDFRTQPSGDSGKKIACGEIHSFCA